MRRNITVVALLFAVAGCSLAPKYERPSAPVPGRYDAAPAQGTRAAADLGWRDMFGDPRLVSLIGLALNNNRDLRIAALHVELARAQYRIQRADQFPTVGASASAGASAGAEFAGDFQGSDPNTLYSVGVGATAFEIDLFGRVRSLKKQALQEYLATEAGKRSAHLALVAEVATQYLAERALDAQFALAESTLATVVESQELTRRLYGAGQRAELDVLTAEAQVQGARAELARVKRLRALAANALTLLVGQALPQDLAKPTTLDVQDIVADIPAGLPSELLQRRPDILAAEHALMGANASIGAARAAFFPTISLTGFAGFASTGLSSLLGGDSARWSFEPRVGVPIFTGGRNDANLDAARVRMQMETARYERAIQTAFREVADGLAARAALDEQLQAQVARANAETRRFELSQARYRVGVESYLTVLTAQRDLYASQQQLIDVKLARLANLISLYRALGGGWFERTRGPAPTRTPAPPPS